MCPSPIPDGHQRGYVIPIGGAEEKINNPDILNKFVELCGGKDANIVIIPTASQLEDTGERYEAIFKELGAGYTYSLPITKRTDAKNEDLLQHLEDATGIFITGGNQLRLSTILGGTPVAQAIRRQNARGTHVAGTSAGAAIISQHMISGGNTGIVPTEGGVNLVPGLGLNNQLVIDQHFSQRNRLSRLLTAVSYNPFLVGIGLDEDTAAFINEDHVFEVVGSGAITVIDPSDCDHTSMAEANTGDAVTIVNVKLHILSSGSHYDLDKKLAHLD